MFTFSLTNEQKKAMLQSAVANLEMDVYRLILAIGHDPDTFDFSKINEMSEIPEPSPEKILYNSYTKMLDLLEKINNL